MSIETGDLVPRIYGGFRGVDFRGEEISLVRSPDCLNVWKDYRHTESIRTRPALALKHSFTDTVYGIFFYKGFMIVHSGTKLYKVQNSTNTEIFSGCREAESNAFIYDDIWYFKDGRHYIQYDGNTVSDVVGYIPTTSIGRGAQSGGTTHQDVNMLSDYRINTFRGDGEDVDVENDAGEVTGTEWQGSTEFWLDVKNIDEDHTPIITVTKLVDDEVIEEAVTDFTVDHAKGRITFAKAPPAPYTDGQDNITVKFKKTVEIKDKQGNVKGYYRDLILKCTELQVFDNRVFFSGNPDYPNKIWHCSLNDPSYCSDNDWYSEGMDETQIKGMVAGNNALWVFREPSEANTNVFYHNPVTDEQYGKVYPSSHSSITIGCVGRAINFNDDIIFFSERGMEGISGDITTEQVAAHRSSLVDRKMISEPEYENMLLEEWEGYLLIFIGDKVYLADSRTAFTNEDHIEYEFFYWQLEKKATSVKVYNGILYVGTEDGVYTMTATTDEDGFYIPRVDITSYWTTPKDKFKTPHKLKTTNKRGCVVEATGDISLYAKTENTDFELIGVYENVKDYFTSRIKRKKWKDIQLKFYSNTRFSLETATLEAFVGGYIKR